MPSAPKLSAMCRAGVQPCEKAFGDPFKRPRVTAKDASAHLTELIIAECCIGLPPGAFIRCRLPSFIYDPGFRTPILMQNPGFMQRPITSSLVVPVGLV